MQLQADETNKIENKNVKKKTPSADSKRVSKHSKKRKFITTKNDYIFLESTEKTGKCKISFVCSFAYSC
jgi:hypothetical protein